MTEPRNLSHKVSERSRALHGGRQQQLQHATGPGRQEAKRHLEFGDRFFQVRVTVKLLP
jgi:hypothetical protein